MTFECKWQSALVRTEEQEARRPSLLPGDQQKAIDFQAVTDLQIVKSPVVSAIIAPPAREPALGPLS